MTERIKYSDVQPGDRLIFERPGGVVYGGAVWQSPTTGSILAGDTFLSNRGKWLPEPTGDVTLTLDTTYRRWGEAWKEVGGVTGNDERTSEDYDYALGDGDRDAPDDEREALAEHLESLGMGYGLHVEMKAKVLREWSDAVLAWMQEQGYRRAECDQSAGSQSEPSVWDRDDLEPDRDPFTGSMVPCVVCGMSPQVGGTGCCSPECDTFLIEGTA